MNNLYLSHNQIDKSAVYIIIKELKMLRVLDVRFNQINKEEKEEIRYYVDK